jgi:hypothetical protein
MSRFLVPERLQNRTPAFSSCFELRCGLLLLTHAWLCCLHLHNENTAQPPLCHHLQVQQRIDAQVQATRLGLHARGSADGGGGGGSGRAGGASVGGASTSSGPEGLDGKLGALLSGWEATRGERLAAVMRRQQMLQHAVRLPVK